ncbi:hypothetical protein QTV49_000359 [Vibrio vulnificus]|nr:hypothetical protein [Vibrio vulnificus]
MKCKLKYLSSVIAVLILAGCGSTSNIETMSPLQVNDSQLIIDVAVEGSVIADNVTPTEPVLEETFYEGSFGIDELNMTIIDDFEKKKMLIDLECQSDLIKISNRIIPISEPPHHIHQRFDKMREDAERVIGDLKMRLDSNPDENLKLAYEQEIARLKLEYEAERVRVWQNEIEAMKVQKLEEIEKSSSAKFECDIRYAENEAERERILYVAKMSAETNDVYDATLNKLAEQLLEIEAEIDSVNEDSFDGVF